MELAEFVQSKAEELGVPGVAVGVFVDGREITAAYGVTSVDNPLPVDSETLFHLASVTKTFTATAIMRLVDAGEIELDAPVSRYVPEFTLDERITVMNLLNHTSGMEWNLIDTSDSDETLADFVAKMTDLKMIAEPGARASYSQAAFNLAGRIIEKVTGLTYEKAVATLVLEPAGLANTFYDLSEVMTRRFVVGHNRDEDGTLRIGQPWKTWRSTMRGNNPGGGAVSSVSDLLRWARYHLDGDETLRRMRTPTVELKASTLGDGFGICWFLKDIGGVATIGHGGSGNGQFADLLIVPERNFAVVSLSNAGPNGYPLNQAVLAWALEHYLGVTESAPEPLPYNEDLAREVAGRYEIDAMNLDVATDGAALTLAVGIKPEIRAASEDEMPPDHPAAAIGFLGGDEYLITEGGLAGQRGYFSRDENGAVVGIDIAGRVFKRAPATRP